MQQSIDFTCRKLQKQAVNKKKMKLS